MRRIKSQPPGGMYLEQGIPDDYYAFTDGELSLTVERCGGINSLAVLDILEYKGKLYPDRTYTPPIFLREGGHSGNRPLYGPAVQFISTSVRSDGRPGRMLHHVPDRIALFPFGFRSESDRFGHRLAYDLCIDGRTVVFRFTNSSPERRLLLVSINSDHIPEGELSDPFCLKTQYAGASHYLDKLSKALPASEVPPLPDPIPTTGHLRLKWNSIGYDADAQAFLMDGMMQFAYGPKAVVVALVGNRPMSLRQTRTRMVLELPWTTEAYSDEIRLGFAVDADRETALVRAREVCAGARTILDRKAAQAASKSEAAPRIEVADMPVASEYARILPAFEHAMVLAETATEACIRAATHKFGYFAAWDQTYSIRSFLAAGDYATARKLVRYLLDIPYADSGYRMLIPVLEEYVAFSNDFSLPDEAYPRLRPYFMGQCREADAKTGLVASKSTFGADFAHELGIDGAVWASCINGWWYNACRGMENFALRRGDDELARIAHDTAARVAEHYLNVFFEPERGYLHSAVSIATGKGTGVYQNISTMAMDYPYGEYLLRSRIRPIAEFQAYALCHPAGRSAVAHDDNAHEMWKNVLMLQHIAHEAKCARAAGLGDETRRILDNFLGLFDRFKVGVETRNLCGAIGDCSQRGNWQAFACAYEALIEGLIGIQWDTGGFGYAPCALGGDMSLERFRFRDARWDISIRGEGPGLKSFAVDGELLHGLARVPADRMTGCDAHTLEIVRGPLPCARPILVAAVGAEITDVEAGPKDLSFDVTHPAHASVKFLAPSAPRISIGEKQAPCEWSSETCTGWLDAVLTPGKRIRIVCV